MKKFIYLSVVVILMFNYLQSTAQSYCSFLVKNSCYCDITLSFVQVCNGVATVGQPTYISNGSWQTPINTVINNQPCCIASCSWYVRISNMNNPASDYANGDQFCCGRNNCTPNNCVTK